jgi:hypothetical protein
MSKRYSPKLVAVPYGSEVLFGVAAVSSRQSEFQPWPLETTGLERETGVSTGQAESTARGNGRRTWLRQTADRARVVCAGPAEPGTWDGFW